jgi:hypothetical protein
MRCVACRLLRRQAVRIRWRLLTQPLGGRATPVKGGADPRRSKSIPKAVKGMYMNMHWCSRGLLHNRHARKTQSPQVTAKLSPCRRAPRRRRESTGRSAPRARGAARGRLVAGRPGGGGDRPDGGGLDGRAVGVLHRDAVADGPGVGVPLDAPLAVGGAGGWLAVVVVGRLRLVPARLIKERRECSMRAG